MAAAAPSPLTGVGWAAGPEAVPPGWTAITVTAEGAPAVVGKGFGHRGGGWYLCVRPAAAQPPPCPVVTDVLVLSERSPNPPGYTRAPEFPDPRTGVSRRKRLLVKLEQPSGAAAVLELQLSSKGKVLPLYTKIGEMGGFAIWCKKGPVGTRPSPDPRPLSTGMEQLSLQPPRPPPPPSRSKGRSPPESLPDPCGIYGLSAMDGVPFALHPKFEPKLSSGPAPILADLTVKSLADIEQEYNYGFVVERTAAARLPPGT
ncbi:multivesicular body subunit 12A [Neopelma chrysocephalum]|uniref:multivesicular body subunit 12A n=1 Tax=Neopelma chrysocephalum TaxID=114329 RepID=UPI000FCD415F|nr:multivesicular body subunit 12A [Neopelma chrysocephalum]